MQDFAKYPRNKILKSFAILLWTNILHPSITIIVGKPLSIDFDVSKTF